MPPMKEKDELTESELRLRQMHNLYFEWARFEAGYMFTTSYDSNDKDISIVIDTNAGWCSYTPDSDEYRDKKSRPLYLIFSELEKEEQVLDFVNKYGLFEMARAAHTDALTLRKILMEAAEMRRVISMNKKIITNDLASLSLCFGWTKEDDMYIAEYHFDNNKSGALFRTYVPSLAKDQLLLAKFYIAQLLNEKLSTYPTRAQLFWDEKYTLIARQVPSSLMSYLWFGVFNWVHGECDLAQCYICKEWGAPERMRKNQMGKGFYHINCKKTLQQQERRERIRRKNQNPI